MVTVSVPAKIFLMGEHAVVYGRPALLAAVNRRLTITVESLPAHKAGNQLAANKKKKQSIIIKSKEPAEYVQHALEVVATHMRLDSLPAMIITIHSHIPAGYHLGSSAAVAAATVGATIYFLKHTWNPMLVNKLAYEAEKSMHKNPSGADNTAVIYGGFLWYRKELPFLRSFWQIPLKVSTSLNNFFLLDTGRPVETTGEMVECVKKHRTENRKLYEELCNQNEEQTKAIAMAIKEENEKALIEAVQKGERTLERMGVVSRKAATLIRKIEAQGGAAKILGGGGRKAGVGYLLCYSRVKPTGAIPIVLGEEGIRLEKKI